MHLGAVVELLQSVSDGGLRQTIHLVLSVLIARKRL